MPTLLEYDTIGVILSAIALVTALFTTAILGIRHYVGEARMPDAVRWRGLEELVGAKEERLRHLDEEIARREISLTDRDQAAAEADHWRRTVEGLKAEYHGLAERRREIEEVREELRQALEDRDVRLTELEEASGRLASVERELEGAERRHDELAARAAELEAGLGPLETRRTAVADDVAQMEDALSALRREKAAAAADVEQQRERLAALATREDDLTRAIGERERDIRTLEERRDQLRSVVEQVQARLDELDPMRKQVEAHRVERERLSGQIDDLSAAKDRLNARLARLREEQEAMHAPSSDDADGAVLHDLRTVPACLKRDGEDGAVWPDESPEEHEYEALGRVADLLEKSGLVFPRRTIDAFHTSLKTAVISPLTVLAGISGTGKSQLPRRYADAMGIHFLKIPVQPRWDSPQDLFGFYNYIEQRYKATDLARALVHLDVHNWREQAEPFRDRMLLVLLDEMNLARVEYYFSEFLSRLEGRPTDERAAERDERTPAEIDIDVGRTGRPKRVYAGQNVLFVGTMNEDESTLALSDKVLDRANVLRFPRPSRLSSSIPRPGDSHRAAGYLSRMRWTTRWIRGTDDMSSEERKATVAVIDEINRLMDELARPFGHRMNQAMLQYVANYPRGPHDTNPLRATHWGMADQIEQRIMPKLHGVDVGVHGPQVQKLADIAKNTLHDHELADAINEAVRRSGEFGMFTWRGFTRRAG